MTYIRTEWLTVAEALRLEHMGFILRVVKSGLDKDQYLIYVNNI